MTTYVPGSIAAIDRMLSHLASRDDAHQHTWRVRNESGNGKTLLAGIDLIWNNAHAAGYTNCYIWIERNKQLGELCVYVLAEHRTPPPRVQYPAYRSTPVGHSFIDKDFLIWLDKVTVDGGKIISEENLSHTFMFINRARLYPGMELPWPHDVTTTTQHETLMDHLHAIMRPRGYECQVVLHTSLVSDHHYHVEVVFEEK